MKVALSVPVQSFLDVYLYLQEVYRVRKAQEERFSYETWAKELGIASKSYLRFATLGKRKISPELTLKFCENIGFGKADREYFTLLVLYTQCEEAQQKRILGEKLTSSLKRNVQFETELVCDELIANPLFMILRNYLSFSDAQRSKQDLIKIFGISEEELDFGLNALQIAGAIDFQNGQWTSTHNWVKVAAKPGNEALTSYHNLSLQKAIAAQNLDPATRSYRSLSMALSKTEYLELLADLNEFAANVCGNYDANSVAERRIYQLNFNLIPWTTELKVTEESSDNRFTYAQNESSR